MTVFKLVIVALLFFVIFNLFKAMFSMLRGDTKQPMSKFIGRRLLYSGLVMLLLIIALMTGLIEPNPRPY